MSWLSEMPRRTPTLRLKRALDVAVAGGALVALSPVLVSGVAAVLVVHGYPPFFIQARPGLHGRVFRILKLRTMSNARDAEGQLLPDAARITRLGRALRASSIDELPELLNVLRGDMSLVGPRPLLVSYLDRYSARQARRHEMPPGITGWAQVNGRNDVSWAEKLEMDVWYVENHTTMLDLRILLRTVSTVVRREGISSTGHATTTEFTGALPETKP